MTAGKGLLLVTMEPPACLEEEFNDWYDTEHLPQRRTAPYLVSKAPRGVCLSGWPKCRVRGLWMTAAAKVCSRHANSRT
jgi:hypothetical protein